MTRGLVLLVLGIPAIVAGLLFVHVLGSGALWRSGVVIAIVLGSLLMLEVLRTGAERSGEGEGAGDLLPYFTYHLR